MYIIPILKVVTDTDMIDKITQLTTYEAMIDTYVPDLLVNTRNVFALIIFNLA